MEETFDFDAIVVGSGITGGWSAKQLTEAGLKVLLLERGPDIPHGSGYTTESKAPWDMPFRGKGDPRTVCRAIPGPAAQPPLHRIHPGPLRQRCGKSLSAGRGTRSTGSAAITLAGARSPGGGRPIAGRTMISTPTAATGTAPTGRSAMPISRRGTTRSRNSSAYPGAAEGLPQLPDGRFQPPMALNAVEADLREQISRPLARTAA